jgi:hypothetical protein
MLDRLLSETVYEERACFQSRIVNSKTPLTQLNGIVF